MYLSSYCIGLKLASVIGLVSDVWLQYQCLIKVGFSLVPRPIWLSNGPGNEAKWACVPISDTDPRESVDCCFTRRNSKWNSKSIAVLLSLWTRSLWALSHPWWCLWTRSLQSHFVSALAAFCANFCSHFPFLSYFLFPAFPVAPP